MMRKRAIKKMLLGMGLVVVVVIITAGTLICLNLNRLLCNALNKAFSENVVSAVYELKFENLEASIFTRSVKVQKVSLVPRETPLHVYPYINSSFRLQASKMVLTHVDLFRLLLYKKLDLNKIELIEPSVDFTIADKNLIFLPFTGARPERKIKNAKKALQGYVLKEFSLVNASFHVNNTAKVREFLIQGINISMKDMTIDRQPDRDKISYQHFDFSIAELTGRLQNNDLRYVHFKDFNVKIDSLRMEETADTLIYHFSNVHTGIRNVDILTADSLFRITMESFNLNYKKKSLEFNNLAFTPNLSDVALQKRYPYRKEIFKGTIGSIHFHDLDFDSLMYAQKLEIGQVLLEEVDGSIYKDLTKPFPPDHHPQYLGQQLNAICMPITIQHIQATKVKLVNTEVTPDGRLGKANINRGTLDIKNITNETNDKMLTIDADAYVENKAHVHLQLLFNYDKPQFHIEGRIDKFDLTDLNSFTDSYTSARIKKGMADGITFAGMVYNTYSTGTMKFLYHDLVIDIELEDKAKWKNAILGLAANTLINSSNPASDNQPVREVQFNVTRDMRTGFISMLVKSVLDGVKETFIMSKENKKTHHEAKASFKEKAREEKKNK